MLGSLNTATLASSGTLDIEVQRWAVAVERDSEAPNRETLDALNDFIHILKIKNI